MQHYIDVVQDRAGNVIGGAIIIITNNLTGLPVTVYSDKGGSIVKPTVTTDTTGTFNFYAPQGRYNFLVTKNGTTLKTVTDVDIVDYQDLSTPTGSTLVGTTTGGTGAVTRTVASKLNDVVSPMDFGAVGNGVTDDRLAVKAALESGRVVDGGGFTYAISGTCQPTSVTGLQNAKFIQIGNNSATNFRTLYFLGLSNFFIDNVTINMGTNVTTIFSDSGNAGLGIWGVHSEVSTTYIENINITRITVTGNGCGSGIQVRHAKRFVIEDCLVCDRVSGSSPDPTNDSQNGIEIFNCANFTLANSNVYDLKTRLGGIDTVKWTRGFLFVEIRDCSIVGCNSTLSDQGYDFSGAYSAVDAYIGSRRFTVSGCTVNSCATMGFKFANVNRDALVTGCIANNIGTYGFLFSPSAIDITGFEQYNTQNIDVVGCKVVNMLGTGWSSSNAQGFRVMNNGLYPTYPRAIRFLSCSVTDTQTIPTTVHGFYSDATKIQYPAVGYNLNVANKTTNCTVDTTVITPFTQLSPVCVIITGTSTQSIANNTVTNVNWDNNIYDTSGLHSQTDNNNSVYLKEPGVYRISAQVQFNPNATGAREVRILKNGVALNRTNMHESSSSAGSVQSLSTTILNYAGAGDRYAIAVWQTSGGALDLNTNESNFTVEKLGG